MEIRSVNLEKVLQDPDFSAHTKSIVNKIKKETYFNFSQFLQDISDIDLEQVCANFDKMHKSKIILNDVIVLSELLTVAEGIGSQDDAAAAENFSYMIIAMTSECLKRKGLITIDYSKISFEDSMKEMPFAQLKE